MLLDLRTRTLQLSSRNTAEQQIVRNRTVKGAVASEHIVQFFDTDESRAQNVAIFLAQGYAAGEPMVVIARPASWAAMIEPLQELGVPVRDATASGMLVVKDASETLRKLSRQGTPDPHLFEDVVGAAVTALAAKSGRRIRAYGEMVDMLAQRSDFDDAIRLEALWNDLSERTPIFLLCGYSAAHFVATGTHRALMEICRAHTDVHRHASDPLADWVLTAAHNTPGCGPSMRH
jgi:hypothetical protein